MKKSILSIIAFCLCLLFGMPCNAQIQEAEIPIPDSASCTSALVVNGSEAISDTTINKDIYIPEGSTLTLSGTVTVNGNIFVYGTLDNTGAFTFNNSLYCLHYSGMSAGGNYNYGYFYSSGTLKGSSLIVKDDFLNYNPPEITHTPGEWSILSEATCTAPGKKKLLCAECGILISNENIAALGHDYSGDWIIDEKPTCSENGSKSKHCTRCSEKSSITSISATGKHKWSDWTVEIDPECDEEGEESRFCLICDLYEDRLIPPTNDHDWDDWYVAKKATISRTGLKKRECFYCDKTQTKTLAKLKPSVKFAKKPSKLQAAKTYKLKLKYSKGDSVKKWKSSNTKVATVSKKGVVKAKKKGTVKITAVMKSGKKATCKISVTAKKKKSSSGKGNSKSKGGGTVYWTPGGSVYHSTKNCPTLSRSRIIKSGSVSSCPKPRGCKVCY